MRQLASFISDVFTSIHQSFSAVAGPSSSISTKKKSNSSKRKGDGDLEERESAEKQLQYALLAVIMHTHGSP